MFLNHVRRNAPPSVLVYLIFANLEDVEVEADMMLRGRIVILRLREMHRRRKIGRTMGRERWKVKEGGGSWEGDGDGG
jgi:hypothetical protein